MAGKPYFTFDEVKYFTFGAAEYYTLNDKTTILRWWFYIVQYFIACFSKLSAF